MYLLMFFAYILLQRKITKINTHSHTHTLLQILLNHHRFTQSALRSDDDVPFFSLFTQCTIILIEICHAEPISKYMVTQQSSNTFSTLEKPDLCLW